MGSIQDEFEKMMACVYPCAPPAKVQLMKDIYYAGALAVFRQVEDCSDDHEIADEIDRLTDEMNDYMAFRSGTKA